MAIFLQVRAGPVHVLLDSAGVHEVTGLDQLRSSERGFYEWRESVLKGLNLAAFLGLAERSSGLHDREDEAPKFAVVYSPSDHEAPFLFEVDEVVWLKDLHKTAWLNVEALPRRTAHFFDGVSLNEDGVTQAFRLRRPLPLDDFMVTMDGLIEGRSNRISQAELE